MAKNISPLLLQLQDHQQWSQMTGVLACRWRTNLTSQMPHYEHAYNSRSNSSDFQEKYNKTVAE